MAKNSGPASIAFLEGIEPERQLRVTFEKLVADPAAATGEICRFLGITHDRALLTPYSGSRMMHGLSGSMPAAGDPSFLLRTGIDPALASPAKEGIPPWPFGEPTREAAARLQYAI